MIQLLLKFGANVHSANEVSQQFAFPCNSIFENINYYCASFAMMKPKKERNILKLAQLSWM